MTAPRWSAVALAHALGQHTPTPEQAAVIDTNILILAKEVRIGRSTFLKGAHIRVTKELADKLEADGKASIIY